MYHVYRVVEAGDDDDDDDDDNDDCNNGSFIRKHQITCGTDR